MGSGRIVGPVLFAYDSLRHKMENFTAFAMMPSIIRMTFAPEKMWGQNFEIAPKSFHFNALVAKNGGAEGNRTPDLIIANDALYQLSYSPAPQNFANNAR